MRLVLVIPKEPEKSAFGLGQSPYNRRSQVGSYCINKDQLAKSAVVDSRGLSRQPKNRFFRFFGYIITVFLLFGCGKPIIILPGDKESAADKILKKVALNIKKETGLIPFGSGGQMMDQIKLLELFFLCHQPVNIEKGRELVLKAGEELIREINSDNRIRPYLNNFPFESKNITIKLYIQRLDGFSFGEEELGVISASEGIIAYRVDGSVPGRLETVYKETYEEALGKVSESFFPREKI